MGNVFVSQSRRLLLACFLSLPCYAWSEEVVDKDLTNQIFERMADITIANENLLAVRHAYICQGVRTEIREGAVTTSNVMYVGVNDPENKLVYDASAHEEFLPGMVVPGEAWKECLRVQGEVYYRSGVPTRDLTSHLIDPKEEKPKVRIRTIAINPILQSLSLASDLYLGTKRDIIDHVSLSKKSKLNLAKFDDERNIVSSWTIDRNSINDFELVLILAKDVGYMPISTKYFSIPKDTTDSVRRPRLVSETRTTWKKQEGHFVPQGMKAAALNSGGVDYYFELSFEWRVGGELPSDFTIHHQLRDWREPIRVLFGKNWLRAHPVE